MDEHVHSAITRGVRRAGADVLTAQEDGHDATDDELVLARATALGRAIVTSDEDFLRLAAAWQRSGREFEGIIYAHSQRVSIGRAVEDLSIVATLGEASEHRNRVIPLPY